MTVNDLERLYDYGYWANRKLLAVVAQLTEPHRASSDRLPTTPVAPAGNTFMTHASL